MAKFYPDTPGSFNGSEGEEQVYETLQELDSQYVVFHSFRWVGDGNRTDMDGEADFVVFHPEIHAISCNSAVLSISVNS